MTSYGHIKAGAYATVTLFASEKKHLARPQKTGRERAHSSAWRIVQYNKFSEGDQYLSIQKSTLLPPGCKTSSSMKLKVARKAGRAVSLSPSLLLLLPMPRRRRSLIIVYITSALSAHLMGKEGRRRTAVARGPGTVLHLPLRRRRRRQGKSEYRRARVRRVESEGRKEGRKEGRG